MKKAVVISNFGSWDGDKLGVAAVTNTLDLKEVARIVATPHVDDVSINEIDDKLVELSKEQFAAMIQDRVDTVGESLIFATDVQGVTYAVVEFEYYTPLFIVVIGVGDDQ